MQELVTVIITTYKRSDTIEEAIKSVLNQTYKNIEIIVVDDNANIPDEREKTAKIVKKYPDIVYIANTKNLGGALARNEGIYKAKGIYIAFLDDDDEYREDKIEKQYKLYKEHENENVGLIFCEDKTKSYNSNYENNVLYQQMINCIAPTSFWFMPKKVLEKVGYFEDSPCKQDSILLLKVIAKGYTVYKVPENLVIFNWHESGDGISGTKKKNIIGMNNYREWCRKYYDKITKQQIRNVEYNFSKQLLTLYIFNSMKNEAKQELKNMIKLKPFNKKTIIGSLKYLFPELYLNELERNKNGKNK